MTSNRLFSFVRSGNGIRKIISNALKDSPFGSPSEKFHNGFINLNNNAAASLPYYSTGTPRGKGQGKKAAASESEERKKSAALDEALAQIEKHFGQGSIFYLGGNETAINVPVVSTGSISLDAALGIRGLPKGRIVEIYGPEASGKTTLALHAIAEAQKRGGKCVFIDAEHALDASFAESIGVNTKDLLLAQPDSGEQALGMADYFIRSGTIDVLVIDSVAALVPRAEMEGDIGDSHMALQARLMSQALRKITHSLSTSQSILIFINQVRSKLQTFGSFGPPAEVTSGGNALKFYASIRLNIRRTAYLKKGEEIIGSTVRVKVAKNKLASPFRTAEFDIEFGNGISRQGEIIDIGLREKIITKSGAWYAYNGENLAQGREKAKLYLKENAALAEDLAAQIFAKLQQSDENDENGKSGAEVNENDGENVTLDDDTSLMV